MVWGILDNLYRDKYSTKISKKRYRKTIKSYNDPDKAFKRYQEIWVKIKYEECLKKLTKKQEFFSQMSGVNPKNQPLKKFLSKALNIPVGTLKPLW